ncbi:uncharacterized protein HD556DRAFT_1392951 [Suillus plorans]|uniref:Uncharacterized protein n=1 Tax=Suillus plorans TaxID=116603 RepID=A0A9P7AIB9_9AGAM|nr:uncharacterized protein HD556DRAFT_1392951 [Suillus plorans]KAG1790163.1 hypothetical protein HD556DRAFT_1392951 [Suillus plorans]
MPLLTSLKNAQPCIAHRHRTIIGYDRICVMDAGTIAVRPHVFKLFYSVLTIHSGIVNIFAMPDGIFHGMCE